MEPVCSLYAFRRIRTGCVLKIRPKGTYAPARTLPRAPQITRLLAVRPCKRVDDSALTSVQRSLRIPTTSPLLRDPPPETSSSQTPPTAIEPSVVETFPNYPSSVREVPAIPRGFGDVGLAYPNRRQSVMQIIDSVMLVCLFGETRRFGLRRVRDVARHE